MLMKNVHLFSNHCFRRHRVSPSHRQISSKHRADASMVQDLDSSLDSLIQVIHANPTKCVLVTTGGAVQALSWLLSVPGASNTIIESLTPYARESLVAMLGHAPEKFCSQDTAISIAKAAYKKAAILTGFSSDFVGIGATCALASIPIKRGEHRAYIACHGSFGTRTVQLTLAKGERSRVGEDDLVSRALVKLLADCIGVSTSGFQLPLLSGSGSTDIYEEALEPLNDPIDDLLAGKVDCVEYGPGGRVVVGAPRKAIIVLPGSFNPLHRGHRQLLDAAVERFGGAGADGDHMEGCFELSIGNADKGLLPAEEVRRRVAQFTAEGLPLILTRAPLFTDKARLLRGCRFVVGFDTAARLVMPKYYGDSHTRMVLDFERLRLNGCGFIVAGRVHGVSGEFKGLKDVEIPVELDGLFSGLPEETFRVDLSSTDLRKQMAARIQNKT